LTAAPAAGPGERATRRLLARLRDIMAHGAAPGAASGTATAARTPLTEVVQLISAELVAEVCSIYVMRPGDLLELAATEGLNPAAIQRTRLRVGEGIVGLCAATGTVMNLPDAQTHPAFAYRPETGEEPYASMLAVPVRRAGRRLGVLAVQNRLPRRYTDDEVEVLETVAMVVADLLAALGAHDGAEEGLAATLVRVFPGAVLVPGIACGRVVLHGTRRRYARLQAEDSDAELARLDAATQRMRREIDALIVDRLPDGEAGRDVLQTYRLMASDSGWLRRAADGIRGGLSAEAAVARAASALQDRMKRLPDPYLRERLADFEDLAGRLLAALGAPLGPDPANSTAAPDADIAGCILVARRLGPAELLDWHARGIAGLVIEEGTNAGHAAIIARALGLPALGGLRGVVDAAETGDHAVLDSDEGQFVLRPEAELRQAYERALEARDARRAGWAAVRDRPAATADGTALRLTLNVGLPMELDQLALTGADGIGLFRTEIAMMARGGVPDAAEQAALYARVLDMAGDKPVLFRTLDLGGDKLLPGTEVVEENPAMGWRSIRVGLDRPSLLRRQLRALLLAAAGRPLSVMFPMIATVAEVRAARALLEAEARRVRPEPATLAIGTMLEVPALLFALPSLLAVADFVSIGSNDLLQFVYAADRSAPVLAGRYDFLSPPMLDLLEQVIRAADAAGKPVSLCGEAAGRPLEALTLVGLGLRSLSMPAAGLPRVKEMLARTDLPSFRRVLASIRRTAAGNPSVREPIAAWVREHGLLG
jgi:phosphotransferase system enzyme I (PtsP)